MKEEMKEEMGMGDENKDQEEPLTIGRKIDKMLRPEPQRPFTALSLSIEEKIQLISLLFPIELGSKVKNKLDEKGFVEMIGIDYRGVLYLTQYKDQTSRWEAEAQINESVQPGPSDEASEEREPNLVKTDIPDPKTHVVGNQKSKME